MIERLLFAGAALAVFVGLSLWAGPAALRWEAAKMSILADRIESWNGTKTH